MSLAYRTYQQVLATYVFTWQKYIFIRKHVCSSCVRTHPIIMYLYVYLLQIGNMIVQLTTLLLIPFQFDSGYNIRYN